MCFVETRDPRIFLRLEDVDICEADVRCVRLILFGSVTGSR